MSNNMYETFVPYLLGGLDENNTHDNDDKAMLHSALYGLSILHFSVTEPSE
jgi:hypothetical protein